LLAGCGHCAHPKTAYESAQLKLKRGETKPALQETEQALRCFPSDNSEWHWRFTVLKADVLHRQGKDNDALALLTAELPASLAHTDVPIRRRLSQGVASTFTQHLADANRYLAEAESLAKAGHPELLDEVVMKIGTVRFFEGSIEEAKKDYSSALQLARAQNDIFVEVSALEGLGIANTREEHYDEAIDWDRQAVELAGSVGAQHSLEQTLGNMAWGYRKLGDMENALALYGQALEVTRKNGFRGDERYWLTGIANVYSDEGDYEAVRNVLEKGLDVARNQDDKRTFTEYLNELSEAAIETGQTDAAEKYRQEALGVERTNPGQSEVLTSMLLGCRVQERRREYAEAEDCFRTLIEGSGIDSSQKWEAQARLAEVYAAKGADAKAEKAFRDSLNTIETARSSIHSEELRMSFLSSSLTFYDDYIGYLIAHGRAQDALRIAELSRSKTLEEGLNPDGGSLGARVVPQQLSQRLHATVLFYWIGEQNSYLWAITSAKLSCYSLPKKAEIERAAKAYRQAILDGHDVLAEENADGKRLYELLVAPAAKSIARDSRVVVLPSETLYGLNFETLIVPEPRPHFWMEDAVVTEASSLTLLAAASQHSGAGGDKSLLLVGNAEPNTEFPALAQAPAEMQKISQHFPEAQCTVLQGKQATASAYLASHPERFSYLHFVTHGTASQTRPLDSAVILSKDGDSYKLYAREIVARPLKAQLVTISACNGAGTRAYAGEGLVGLSWAFLRAGARNVVASLWEVSDASSTGELMDAFYGGLDRGEDPAAALRDAKLKILKANGNTVFRKAFYWAPFQLYVGG
jgi:CHAT domain-containing protein